MKADKQGVARALNAWNVSASMVARMIARDDLDTRALRVLPLSCPDTGVCGLESTVKRKQYTT